VLASPRQILAAQTARLAERGWTAMAGTELEFIVYTDTYEQAAARDYRDLIPANQYNVDYSILGTSGSSRCCAGSATRWPPPRRSGTRSRAGECIALGRFHVQAGPAIWLRIRRSSGSIRDVPRIE